MKNKAVSESNTGMEDIMRKMVKGLTGCLGELVLLAGAAAVAVGVGMIYLPAGLITGGVLCIAGAVLSLWGGESAERGDDGR